MSREKVRPCTRCRRPTRPPRALIANFPGTLERAGEQCRTCYVGGAMLTNPEVRKSIEEIRAGLDSYLSRRRDRQDMMNRLERISA